MSRPPRIPERLLEYFLPSGVVGHSIRGDLRQEYEELVARHPRRSFRLWYWLQSFRLAARYAVQPLLERSGGLSRRGDRRETSVPGAPRTPSTSGARLEPSPQPRPRGGSMTLETIARDLRYGARMLVKDPGFAIVAIVTLALGIGANTAMFSVVNGVLLRPLSFPDADRLVSIERRSLDGSGGDNTTPGNFEDWRLQADSFAAMAAYGGSAMALTGSGEARRVLAMTSAGSLLQVLGTPPHLGRLLTMEDDAVSERVAVLSHALWQEVFGGDPESVGRAITLGGELYTVVGVMPAEFDTAVLSGGVDLWIPSGWSAEYRQNRTNYAHQVVARLKPDVTRDRAQQEMEALMAELRAEYPQQNRGHGVAVVPLHDELVEGFDTLLTMLMAAVALVLLIACVNLANLLMARATARDREVAIRRAVGASSARLIRQVLTESLLLAAVGGVAGVGLCYLLLDAIVALLPPETPYLNEVGIDPTVLAFTFGLAGAAGVAFGLLPALRMTRRETSDALREAARGSSRTGWSWNALVVAEVGLSVVLLIGAGLLLRSFFYLVTVDPGFATEGVFTFRVSLPQGYEADQRIVFWQRLRDELGAIPGVTSVSLANQLPSSVNRVSGWINYADRPVADRDRSYLIPYRAVTPGHHETLGIPLVRGRFLIEADGPAAPAALVNQAVQRRFFPDRDPVGERIVLGSLDGEPWYPPLTIVGLVGDVRNDGLGNEPAPTVYLPAAIGGGWSSMVVAVRSEADPAAMISAARERVRALEPGAPMYDVQTVEQMYREQMGPTRSVMLFLGAFAGLGLLMAAVGVFGILAYSVGKRTREMGIRMALGASGAALTAMVVGQALAKVLLGTALGVAGALLANRLLVGMLYGVSSADPLTVAAVIAILTAVAVIAAFLPARRAATVAPVEALRAE